jgi:hypothetical protein
MCLGFELEKERTKFLKIVFFNVSIFIIKFLIIDFFARFKMENS